MMATMGSRPNHNWEAHSIDMHFPAPYLILPLLVFPTCGGGDSTPTSPISDGRRRLKILVNNPLLGWSHVQFHGRLADLLTDAGHEVVCTFMQYPCAKTWLVFTLLA